jgi:hypothetical protein
MKRPLFFRAAGVGAALSLAAISGASIVGACGGTDHGPPAPAAASPLATDPGSGPYQCSVEDPYEVHVIEDFEGAGSGAATGWYTNNEICYECQIASDDCIDSGTWDVWLNGAAECSWPAIDQCLEQCLAIQPSPSYGVDPLPAARIPDGGRCDSQFAMQVLGGPFVHWGGSLGRRLVDVCPDGGQACGFDASSYDGVLLWMRTAPGYTANPRVIVSDRYTDTNNNQALALTPQGAYCDPTPPAAYPSHGCDKFGTFVDVSENWTLYVLPFAEMRQAGWGVHEPGIDTSGIMGIEFDFAQGTWDLWIDDVGFYRLKPRAAEGGQ